MTTTLPPAAISELIAALSEDAVLLDEEDRARYARDECPTPFVVVPAAVLVPRDGAAVARAMTVCAARGIAVTPRGAGSGKVGGAVAAPGGVVLTLERLTSPLEIDVENGVARVGAGVVTADLMRAAEDAGWFFPPDPASLAFSTIGGNIATNAGGPRALRYGVTRDYVLGLDVVLSSGARVALGRGTTKGVAGYDLTGLLVGSEGTLGVIVGATLRLVPAPRGTAVAMVTFPSAERAARAVSATLSAGLLPTTIEYLDRRSIAALRAVAPPFRFADGVEAALLVECDGPSDAHALDVLAAVGERMTALGATDTEVAADARRRRDLWETRRLLSDALKRVTGRKVSEDVVVPRAKLPELVAFLDAAGADLGLETAAFGHAGDGNLHAQVLYRDDADLPRVDALLDRLFAETLALGGSVSGEHGIGLAKKRWLPLEHGPDVLALERAVRRVFDPRGIMNPGKIFDDE